VRFPSWNAVFAGLLARKREHKMIEYSLNNQQRDHLPAEVLRLRIDERKFSIRGVEKKSRTIMAPDDGRGRSEQHDFESG
jgi:hypothetical protein